MLCDLVPLRVLPAIVYGLITFKMVGLSSITTKSENWCCTEELGKEAFDAVQYGARVRIAVRAEDQDTLQMFL